MSSDLWTLVEARVQAVVAEGRAVVDADRPLTPGWLEQAAAWIGEVTPSWGQLAGSVPLERSYRRLVASMDLEAWLICWPQDVHLQLHDHGGASGAFQVVDGSLAERSLVGGDGFGTGFGAAGAALKDRLVPEGEVVSFDGSYIHDVRNTRSEPATSVHLYGPASRPMAFYRLDGGLVRTVGPDSERALRGAEIDAEGRVGRDDGARALHPSGSSRQGADRSGPARTLAH